MVQQGEVVTMTTLPTTLPSIHPHHTMSHQPVSDPWLHRSQRMRCESCMWFVTKKENIGRCRRHAPTMNGYPVVFTNDWCGDHKLSEEWHAMQQVEKSQCPAHQFLP